MAKTNVPKSTPPVFTHEGAKAQQVNPYLELRRTIMACLLWEDSFYESGVSVADRIAALVKEVEPAKVANLAIEARQKMYVRHAPLFMLRELARRAKEPIGDLSDHRTVGSLVAYTLPQIIQRPDELAEFLALYWKEKKDAPIANSVKRGLAAAFTKFDEYQLQKYNRDGEIKLRDVMFLTHPKPIGGVKGRTKGWRKLTYSNDLARGPMSEQELLFDRLAKNQLAAPDTWETNLSAGADKKETFERLIKEHKLGGLATLMNLRNMIQAHVDPELIRYRLRGPFNKVLPFRFITAARYAPAYEPELEEAMYRAAVDLPEIPGATVLLVDVSGSMDANLSDKGETMRSDAAVGIAIHLREKCEKGAVCTFSDKLVQVPPRRGFALRDAINNSQGHGGTNLYGATDTLRALTSPEDRIIVITDEQAHPYHRLGINRGIIPAWTKRAYVINVGTYQHGVSYGNGWTHIDGWSERVLEYILAAETEETAQ